MKLVLVLDWLAKELDLGEPLDWMQTRHPRRWRFGSEIHTYDWK